MKTTVFYGIGFLISILIIILIVELFLRIFDPFPSSMINGKLNLQPGLQINISNLEKSNKLDKQINVKFNELGFRGDAVSEFKAADISILLIGGSTTQCIYISDGKTWGDLLKLSLQNSFGKKAKVSLINAGLDGHSTFGHLKLVEINNLLNILKPTHVVVMAGINDMAIFEKALIDGQIEEERKADRRDIAVNKASGSLLERSYIFGYWNNFKNLDLTYANRNRGDLEIDMKLIPQLTSKEKELDSYKYDKSIRPELIDSIYSTGGFKSRLISLQKNIKSLVKSEVIFVTQASLYGAGFDPDSGANLGSWNLRLWSGESKWRALMEYNIATLSLASMGIPVIDLGGRLEKRSDYFYDEIHLTNSGARAASEIISNEIINRKIIQP